MEPFSIDLSLIEELRARPFEEWGVFQDPEAVNRLIMHLEVFHGQALGALKAELLGKGQLTFPAANGIVPPVVERDAIPTDKAECPTCSGTGVQVNSVGYQIKCGICYGKKLIPVKRAVRIRQGWQLRDERHNFGVTAAALAFELNCEPSRIWKMEAGLITPMDIEKYREGLASCLRNGAGK